MLSLPLESYDISGYRFGQRIRRRIFLWAVHLGDDVAARPGASVRAIGEGEVVWSEMRLGSSKHRNWGGIVILRHESGFFSLYGHMKDLRVRKGERIERRQELGVIAPGPTPENGWWETPHLHFAVYTGPWRDRVLPGYGRPDDWLRRSPRRTRLAWWHNPQEFIKKHKGNVVS